MNTHPTHPLSSETLAFALQALGVEFVQSSSPYSSKPDHLSPARLISALAQSPEARLRLALIPLFLEHPEFAARVPKVAEKLGPSARLTLQCYYTAAVYMQSKYIQKLERFPGTQSRLPDYFSIELGLSRSYEPDSDLHLLATRQGLLSGTHVNWFGTYEHAVAIWFKGLELNTT